MEVRPVPPGQTLSETWGEGRDRFPTEDTCIESSDVVKGHTHLQESPVLLFLPLLSLDETSPNTSDFRIFKTGVGILRRLDLEVQRKIFIIGPSSPTG